MSRRRRIALMVAAALAGLALVAIVAGILTVRTQWFRDFVREKMIAAIETGTGGKAEIGAFTFDWTSLRARVENLVIHGLERPGEAPLFRARLVEVDLKLLSGFKKAIDIRRLLVDAPHANVIVYPDGRTNLPSPKVKKSSDKTALETIVDLAVGNFELRNGLVAFADRKTPLDARGENLRARLLYNLARPAYTGEINISPLRLGGVDVDVRLPLTLEKDRIALNNARLATARSQLNLSGAVDHLTDPRGSARVAGRVALDEVKQALRLNLPLDTGAPHVVALDLSAGMAGDRVQIERARINLGRSEIHASGTLQQKTRFSGSLALDELGRLFRVEARPEGEVKLAGDAVLRSGSDYRVNAQVDARGLAFRQGARRYSDIGVDARINALPERIELAGLRVAAFGGSLTGSGELRRMERFRFAGNLRDFEIRRFADMGYAGIVSGPLQAEGNVRQAAATVARADLTIAPGRGGVPVSGRVAAAYNGGAQTVEIAGSYLALPHTRLNFQGSLGEQISVHLVSRNLDDFRPLAPRMPVALNGGAATMDATVSGKLDEPRIAARVNMTGFSIERRPFTRLAAELEASPSGAIVRQALLTRGAMETRITASVGLRRWKAGRSQPLRVNAGIRNADAQDVLALAGRTDIPIAGPLTASAQVAGTVGDPRGSAALDVVNGTLSGEPFDRLSARVLVAERSIDLTTLQWVAGASRIDARASYQHPAGDLRQGTVSAHVAGSRIDLEQFRSLAKNRPGLGGGVTLNGDFAGTVQPGRGGTEFQLTAVNAEAAVRNLRMGGKDLGDFVTSARTSGGAVIYRVNSNFAGSDIRVDGRSLLAGNHETTATARISRLPIEQVLAFAGRRDIQASGMLSADAKLSGTAQDPRAWANLTVTGGRAMEESFDQLRTELRYDARTIEVPSLEILAGPSRITLSAHFAHPPGNLREGRLQFRVNSSPLQLARFKTLQKAKPGLAGTLELAAGGEATLRPKASPRLLLSTLNAHVATRGLSVDRKPVGDLTATAQTRGAELAFEVKSDFGAGDIRGSARMQLTGDYPISARMAFNRLTYSGLGNWMRNSGQRGFDASVDGQAMVAGPVTRPEALRGELRIDKLEAHSTGNGRNPVEVHNAAPIVAVLDRSTVTVNSARLTGRTADLALSGTASFAGSRAVNLRAHGRLDLQAVQAFNPDIFSSGEVALNAAVTGTAGQPSVNGRLELRKASFNMIDMPNGLSNASGVIAFNGTEAVIQNLSGESGGGKVTLAGTVSYGGPEMNFRVQANADQVRVHYPRTVTTETDARLTLAGSTSRSLLSGTVTIREVALRSQSDMGSVLSQAATPPSTSGPNTGLLGGMRFDVRVETAPNVQFRTSLTQNVQADARLRLRGTPSRPGMLGRVNVSRGEVVFFGYKYNIDQGSVAFYSPNRINPILNIDLSTSASGVDVTLNVAGPMDRLKLSYRSDPPLQFSEIVSLLASGKAPTSDPVLAARQPPPEQQNLQQKGASTLLGQAVANPVTGRLQRLFGVSKLKIDPQITGSDYTPQARLTLEQQITRSLTFTYIQDVTQSNPQIVRIEWAIDPTWSAIAQRQVNGQLGLDLFYKKRFW